MPAFTIHIAIAEEYMKKHEREIQSTEQFLKGTIAPDWDEHAKQAIKNKSKSHYGKWDEVSNIIDITKFLEDETVDLNQDYWKGYLLHLVTDHYFANIVFKTELEQIQNNQDNFYYDYYCLNEQIIQRYKIPILDELEQYMNPIEGKPKYLKIEKVIRFIEEMSSINLEKVIKKKQMNKEEYR